MLTMPSPQVIAFYEPNGAPKVRKLSTISYQMGRDRQIRHTTRAMTQNFLLE